MVYIYKKVVGNKGYYYLRLSERKGKRVISKDIAYLGNSIEIVKKNLEKLSKYKEEIRKSYKKIHNFLEPNYYLEKVKRLKLKRDAFLSDNFELVEACKVHFDEHFNKLDEITKKEVLGNFVVEFSFNTTSIEGNTINLEEARNLLENGLTPKDKSLREIYDLQNTERVFLDIYNSKKEINHEFIINLHKGLMANIDLRTEYRKTDVRVIKSNFDATPGPYVKTDMNLLLNWYNKTKGSLHPLVLATIFHHKFEKIHPFMDGNGRTGRMLFNYILLRNKYPPTIIHKKTRKEYLESLRKADKSGLQESNMDNYFDLVQFCANELIEGYWNLFL